MIVMKTVSDDYVTSLQSKVWQISTHLGEIDKGSSTNNFHHS